MDNILDEALDELDDDSDQEDVADQRANSIQNPSSTLASLATTNAELAAKPPGPPAGNDSPGMGSVTATGTTSLNDHLPRSSDDPAAAAFQQMLQKFVEGDGDNDGNIANFMQQVQSQLEETSGTKSTKSTTTTTPDKVKKDSKETSSRTPDDGVESTIAAILGEMANASIDDNDNMVPEDDQMLHDMFQSMASGQLPQGLQDLMNDDDPFPGENDLDPEAFMDGMMEQLLSKELMYEPMKQVTEQFPAWLETNKEKLTEDDWEQRNQQYKVFQELVQVYEQEDGDSKNKTERLMELMQKVQEYGQPPAEIINEIAPGLELDNEGLPKMEGMPPFGGLGEDGECVLM
jgi:peroxin-19